MMTAPAIGDYGAWGDLQDFHRFRNRGPEEPAAMNARPQWNATPRAYRNSLRPELSIQARQVGPGRAFKTSFPLPLRNPCRSIVT